MASVRTRSRFSLRSHARTAAVEVPIHGTARLGRRTKHLVTRLGPGDIAIIDHPDLDRMAAEDLAACGVRAVVNTSPSTTGRYPNPGPLVLARTGTRLIDVPSDAIFDALDDGDSIVIDGGDIRCGGDLLAEGRVLDASDLDEDLIAQRGRVDAALADFAENTMAHIREESALLSDHLDLPRTRTRFRGRHVLIVVRGRTYREDLRALRGYIRDVRPLIVAVDGGADAVLKAGLVPDAILGDMDSASDAALRSGAELIVHAYPSGEAPGRERLEDMGLDHVVVPAAGTSQDVAMLLAYEKGAALLVSVGAHFNLVDFLDKNRAGMSSTFLTRLRVGDTLVDAKGVSRLYNPGPSRGQMGLFFLAALAAIAIVVITSEPLGDLVDLLWLKIKVLLGL
jgi:uncharacterized membrane-anchored protein